MSGCTSKTHIILLYIPITGSRDRKFAIKVDCMPWNFMATGNRWIERRRGDTDADKSREDMLNLQHACITLGRNLLRNPCITRGPGHLNHRPASCTAGGTPAGGTSTIHLHPARPTAHPIPHIWSGRETLARRLPLISAVSGARGFSLWWRWSAKRSPRRRISRCPAHITKPNTATISFAKIHDWAKIQEWVSHGLLSLIYIFSWCGDAEYAKKCTLPIDLEIAKSRTSDTRWFTI
jgi:hypothetical protein